MSASERKPVRKSNTTGPEDQKKKLIVNIVLGVCCAALIFSVAMIVSNSISEKNDVERVNSDYHEFITPTSYPEEEDPYKNIEFPLGIMDSMKSFYARCSDVVGFLKIDGIDGFGYPVVQSTSNEKYFRKTIDGKTSREGTATVDYRVDLNDPLCNLLIGSHNNNNGLMFGPLEKYNAVLNGLDMYKKAPTITYYSLYNETKYKIVTCIVSNKYSKDGPIFDFIEMLDLGDEAVFNNFKHEIERRGVINTDVDLQFGDQILTLYTCAYYFKDCRVLLVARQLRPGEIADVDVSVATINYDAVMPDSFVDAKGIGTKASLAQ